MKYLENNELEENEDFKMLHQLIMVEDDGIVLGFASFKQQISKDRVYIFMKEILNLFCDCDSLMCEGLYDFENCKRKFQYDFNHKELYIYLNTKSEINFFF